MGNSFNDVIIRLEQDRRCDMTSFAGLVSEGDIDDQILLLVGV